MNQTPRERRATPLSDEQIEALAAKLADQVAERAYQKFTLYVGRSVLANLRVLLILAAVGVFAVWLAWRNGWRP